MKNRIPKLSLLTLFVCLAFLLFAGNALAITMKMSVEELTNGATTIIRGTVLDLRSHWNEEKTHIVTDVTLSAEKYVKGYEGGEVTIQVPGGTVGEHGEWVEDVPTFEKGQEVILFLGDDEYFRVVGWHQGKFTIEKDTVLEIGLPVDTFMAGIQQTMAGSAPQWAMEKLPEVSTRGEIGALAITSINPTSGPAHADQLGGTGCASNSTSVTFNGSAWPPSQGGNDHALFYYQGSQWVPGCVDSWSSSQIMARVPARASSGDVYIYLDGAWDGPGGPFEVTYSYGGGKWPAGSYPQPMSELYYINENTSDCSGEGAAVQAADTTWDNVASADFYFRYGGTTSTTAAGEDGENSVLWRDLGSSGPIAVCTIRWSADPHTIVEFDIEFNDFHTWSTTGAPGTYDVQSVATHELGHALTLRDLYGSADSEKTMYGLGSPGETKQRTLESEDEAGISYIYPAVVGPVVYDSNVIDDDNLDNSSGNDDGTVDPGETIELYVDLYNQGSSTATGVAATISTSDPYVTFPHNTSSSYPDIPGGGTGTNDNDFDFEVASSTPHDHVICFDLNITSSNGGPWSDSFCVTVGGARTYLPIVLNNYIPGLLYFDDFSDPNSGWPIWDGSDYSFDYNDDNYRIQLKRDYYAAWAWQGFACTDCTIEVEAWRSTGADSSYGIVFGLNSSGDKFYIFYVEPGRREYGLQRYDEGAWVTLIPYTYSSYINSYYSHNRLKVTREGSQIKLYVNGHHLTTHSDSVYVGNPYVGVIGFSGPTSPVWLRYDDFTVWDVGYGTASATEGGSGGVGTAPAPPD
jgi:hypothetical protein